MFGFGVLVRVARVPLVAELGENDEDLVRSLASELDVLVDRLRAARRGFRANLDDLAGTALLRRGFAVDDLL